MLKGRKGGILLHPTSLPGPAGIGTLDEHARRFVDVLAAMKMTFWQVLPLTPPAAGNSPYSAFSAFAGNPLLINLEELKEVGDLPVSFKERVLPSDRVDYAAVEQSKNKALHQAAERFFAAGDTPRLKEFWHFCDTNPWLHDYALFMALKNRYKGKSWHLWPTDAALMTKEIYEKASVDLGVQIGFQKYIQWQFHRQWHSLKAYAASKGIAFIGDIPIFVAYDSADVWSNRDIFLLDDSGQPSVMAGVPPDYFSSTGQLWGNPLYNWNVLALRGYDWWIERFKQNLDLFDYVRIDHFRGFEAAWHVPAGEETAVNGVWVKGPGESFFNALNIALEGLPIIAEDLGVITPEVEALRDRCGFPGMKILQFAFDSGPDNIYLPHNHVQNSIVYTGTHDNDTTLGWFSSLEEHQRFRVQRYFGTDGSDLVSDMIRFALMSVANTAIIPLQDILALPGKARMNTPGTSFGNWEWRFSWDLVSDDLVERVAGLLELYGRQSNS